MKRLIHILVAGLLLFTTTGFTITKHYCGGNLVEVAVNVVPESCCDMNNGDCCKNESEFFQLSDNFAGSQVLNVDFQFVFDFDLLVQESLEVKANVQTSSIHLDRNFILPPDLSVSLADIQSFRL
ncbi:MAG: hypothetical protein GY834_05265 [Bacteroidetes bacterium]|nr:hypothetical protein [Bacteroidota bacterium]